MCVCVYCICSGAKQTYYQCIPISWKTPTPCAEESQHSTDQSMLPALLPAFDHEANHSLQAQLDTQTITSHHTRRVTDLRMKMTPNSLSASF